jgi:methionyl aminopeptidase
LGSGRLGTNAAARCLDCFLDGGIVKLGMMRIKSLREIERMRQAGRIVAQALRLVRDIAKPGVRTGELDQAVEEWFRQAGAEPLFKGVQNGPGKPPFPAVICASVNDQGVHGVPGDYVLREGDILSVDTGCRLGGWCADAAVTIPIGRVSPEAQRLIDVTRQTLELAIREMGRQRYWSQVARRMEQFVRRHGFSVVENFVGHGIGRQMHEEPQVPNFMSPALLARDFRLRPGLVLAVEPMVNAGTKEVHVGPDHWTVYTADGKLSAHFEHTIALTESGPQVLTE